MGNRGTESRTLLPPLSGERTAEPFKEFPIGFAVKQSFPIRFYIIPCCLFALAPPKQMEQGLRMLNRVLLGFRFPFHLRPRKSAGPCTFLSHLHTKADKQRGIGFFLSVLFSYLSSLPIPLSASRRFMRRPSAAGRTHMGFPVFPSVCLLRPVLCKAYVASFLRDSPIFKPKLTESA